MNVLNEMVPNACAYEPFNPDMRGPYPGLVQSLGLKAVVDSLYAKHRGIKHVWEPNGWPFTIGSRRNAELLCYSACKTVILYRTNVVNRILSQHIAEASGVWMVNSNEDARRRNESKYPAINLAYFDSTVTYESVFLEAAKNQLSSAGIVWIAVPYEAIFDVMVDVGRRREEIEMVLRFLGATDLEITGISGAIDSVLSYPYENTASVMYDKIENICELRRRCTERSGQ